MFILMGETEKKSPVKRGLFDCPICQSQQDYSHYNANAYFTIFGLSVAKLNSISDYLSCDGCSSCFSPQLLENAQAFNQATDQTIFIRALCYLLSGYGDTMQARSRLLDIYRVATGQTITQDDITHELATIESGDSPTLPFLTQYSHLVSETKKQQLVVAAFQFADGSCMMEHHDRVRINTIGSSLGLSLPEIEYLIVNNQ